MSATKKAIVILGLISLQLANSAVAAEKGRRIDPVVISGAQLDSIVGAAPAEVFAYSYSGGYWKLIPFQVDERMDVSAYQTWTTRTTVFSYAFDSGIHTADPNPVFDHDDELVFMAASAGAKAPEGAGPGGADTCEEIKLEDPLGGGTSYVYACRLSRSAPLAPESLVKVNDLDYEKGSNVISAPGYEVSFPAGNPVNFTSYRVRGENGLMKDVVDRFKMGVTVEIVFGIVQYPLTDADYVHYIRGVKAGPIRVIKEYESVLETFGGAQLRTYNQVVFYPYHIEYNMMVRGAGNWGKNVHKSDLVLAVDLDDQGRGMKFVSEKNLEGRKVDGFTSASEIKMDYGPTEWAAVTGNGAGTLMVHMGLDRTIELYKDLYYSDNEAKTDPPEDYPGMIGKFGYILRNLQREGFDYWPVRFAVYGDPRDYAPGLEAGFVDNYLEPLRVKIGRHQLRAIRPDAPLVYDGREDPPRSIYEEREKTVQLTKFIAPAFILDPYLLGYGPGASYSDIDFLGTGTNFFIMVMFTERGYSSYEVSFDELRWIEGVDSFEINAGIRSFPAEPYYGQGNTTDLDHLTLYWWRENKVQVSFEKYFSGIYGAQVRVGYRDVSIDSGIQPTSGTGEYSIEEKFGKPSELEGNPWGRPVYGMEGGNLSFLSFTLFRDMRDAKNLPKFGNYEAVTVDLVSGLWGADYDYAKVSLDLRGYYHPDFLNPIPWLDSRLDSRRTFLNKFIGPDKNRTIAGRIFFTHLIAEEIEWYGEDILKVPFSELTYLGSSSTVKGYASKRFRDNDMIYGSIEYRWRFWRFQDMAVYYDIGMVTDDVFNSGNYEDVDWHDGYGISWRIHVPPNISVSFEYGFSEEVSGNIYQMNVGF